ncbi:MAG: leucyl/phenylalanyl-tRNA--protein transferase, partial [Gammaproteobacteria bacterium]|nr:leucyl/phenylalanyl-tRNA--protein transferase [Gammaproteobacteria bacterium]
KFHVSRSFRRTLNNHAFQIKTNTAFKKVMLACAKPRSDDTGTWITDTMIAVYNQLHQNGIAHSFECWQDDRLVGGMYGLILGDMFFGESMFSAKKDTSKIVMHYMCTTLKPFLIDAQVYSKHLATLGAEEIDRQQFIEIVRLRQGYTINI